MLALLILVAVVVIVVVAVLLSRRLNRDDEHSVAGYHRQLLTLEQIKAHTLPGGADADADAASEVSGTGSPAPVKPSYPESAVRVSGSAYVRVTDGPNPTPVPPVPPPPLAGAKGLVTFDDAGPVVVPSGRSAGGTETFSFGRKDRAMDSMNRRPRRLGGPIVAVAVVGVVIVVLVIAGSHKNNPPAKHHLSSTASTGTASRSHHAKAHPKKSVSTTTTTQLPLVSLPSATSVHDATYTTRLTDYSLVVSATTQECYVQVDNVTTGTAIFAGVMTAGEQRTIPVTGPVTIDVGAPSAFAATVNGTSLVLPYGYQTPFNLHLLPAGSAGASGTTTTTSG
jgi:hypothetical protein